MRPNTGLGLSLSLLGSLLSSTPIVEAAKPKNAILLSEVQSLTLKANKQTTHRRVSAIPQLKCVSPRAICRLHEIDTLRCVNQGSSYSSEDIEWACTATDLPTTLRLGSTEVICEGYSSPDDPYVLRGSCGVEYRLVLTEEGERRYPELASGKGWKLGGGNNDNGETDWGGYVFAIIFFAVLGWIIYSACIAADGGNNNPRRNTGGGGGGRRPGGGGGGGGGGWGGGWGPGGGGGGWDDPPPPYSKSTNTAGEQGWRPGFWSGAATGAAAGYFAGNRAANNNNTTRGGLFGDGGGGSSFWGGGGGGGGPSSSRRNDSGSGSGSSSGRYSSTGFGSTSRR
ncbi:transmembrane protein [Naviculisporaceae sp. PSN 640]